MYVIGTAGHVDHGKSSLVQALTGIDPDRLAEEKAREMTIDLGFAWLRLEGVADEVGVIDVPGHRDFIENMLAGVGGIDLALFVVAADEGVMPQTKEHLAILNLLEIGGGVVALTKVDLIDDPEWLEMVMLDLGEAFAGTVLADAPILPVSAHSGAGLAALKQTLAQRLAATEPRPDLGRPRLPIDRVFSLPGFGTIVTGTLIGGRFQVGDAIEVQPTPARRGRIRGLQTHKTKLDVARPGSRVAVNLTGIDKEEIARGDVLAAPGTAQSTLLFDAAYRHLSGTAGPLRHNMDVKLFVGAAEVPARTRLIGARQLEPGEEGWLQLALSRPVALARGDRFILRRPSPGETLGGGRVLDPTPGSRHRRFRPEAVSRLQTLAQGTPAELLLQTLRRLEPATAADVFKQAGLDREMAEAAWQTLAAEGQLILLESGAAFSRPGWQKLADRLVELLAGYHRDYPLRPGIPREELRSRLKLAGNTFNALLGRAAAEGLLVEEGAFVRAPGHAVRFTAEQQAAVDQLMRHFTASGINSPSVRDVKTAVGDNVYFALLDQGRLRQVREDVVYTAADYEQYTSQIRGYLQQHGRINAAQVRDLFNTSRKYAIALLEHLDEIKVTRRVGDDRELT
jgi:selenocysteine-specific elongation factor